MRKISILFFLLTAITTFSWGQNLDDYLIQAGENNPELQAYYHEYLASLEKAPQVSSLPDPELSMGIFFSPMERWMGNQVADIKLMQMFPWFGTLGVKKEEANLMAHVRYQVFLDAKNKLFYQVKSTYYDLYQIQEEIQINQENLEYLKEYERLALVKFKSASSPGTASSQMPQATMGSNRTSTASGVDAMNGSPENSSPNPTPQMPAGSAMASGTGMSDILRIRMQVRELENTIANQSDQLIPLRIKFNQLLNREINTPISELDTLVPTQLIMDKMAVLDSISSQNPLLAMYDTEMEVLDQQEQMARLDGRPMFGAGVNYMPFQARPESGMMMGGKDMVMPMVSLTLPIYRKKTNSRIKETEYLREATLLKKEKKENMLAMQWANAILDLENANRNIALYHEQSQLAEQTLRLLLTSFSTNGQEMEEVLRVNQQLLNYKLQSMISIVQQHKSLAMLESLGTGTPLN
ncbi:TolC family protein [Algoriphagus vanfongensis]|uniref:TolC family protein n=1 Tax=Algoriphagus vanfongensis TaxID=426371 RepID=UPI0004232DC3|nr:TolC family protein [Algoriphagus vanfongensis]